MNERDLWTEALLKSLPFADDVEPYCINEVVSRCGLIADAAAAQARARGLFEPAPDLSPLTPTGAERLGQAEQERDRAHKMLWEIAEEIEAFRLAVDTYDPSRLYALGRRAKEISNDLG